jgi:hypothetical protein
MDQAVRTSRWGLPAPATPRRANVSWAARLACGAALTAALLGFTVAQPVAAQDDTIVLSAGGSTLVVSPGTADAYSAVAEAHAGPGYAETDAAGARALAINGCAMTEASAARAIGRPDQGAMTEADGGAVLSDNDPNSSLVLSDPKAFAEQLNAQIMADNKALQMINGDGQASGSKDDPVRAIAKNHKDTKEIQPVTPETCPKEKAVKPPPAAPEVPAAPAPTVVQVPVTGAGMASSSQLASLFAAASAAAALGSVGLARSRRSNAGASVDSVL